MSILIAFVAFGSFASFMLRLLRWMEMETRLNVLKGLSHLQYKKYALNQKMPPNLCPHLRQLLIDVQNSFSGTFLFT